MNSKASLNLPLEAMSDCFVYGTNILKTLVF